MENFLVYGLGGIIKSIIPLVMVPVVTRLMPDSTYFGISDLSNTIVSFGSAIAIMGMYDAMFRMFFEKEDLEFKKRVCSTTVFFVVLTTLLTTLVVIAGRFFLAKYVFRDTALSYVVFLSAAAILTGATNGIIAAPTRMENKRKVFLVTNTLGSALSYAIAIPLLLRGYYIIALPLATVISGLVLEASFLIMNHGWFRLRYFDRALLKSMLAIALPLVPNFLIYWVFNSSDKLMIANLLTVAEEGIYSVGAKLGMASQLIYTAFAGGWQYFAFSTMKDGDQVQTNSKVFEYLGAISFAFTMMICVIARPLYRFLFTGEYARGYIVSPYLFLAPLLLMLYQVEGNQLLVIRKTWPMPFILSAGAVANIALNLILIPRIGIEGAAIATLAGYGISIIICTVVLLRIKQLDVSGRFLMACGIMMLFFAIWRTVVHGNIFAELITMIAGIALLLFFYKKEFGMVLIKLKCLKR